MRRRVAAVLVTVALACAALATVGTGVAYGVKATAAGSIACDWVDGRVKLPKLVNGGTTPGTVSFKGTLGNCRDASGENGPTPFGITGARIKGSFAIPANACTPGDDPVTGGAGDVTIKWTGSQKLVATHVTSSDSGYQFNADGNFFSLPADAINGSGTLTGSFAGDAAGVFGTSNQGGAAVTAACTPKTKGLKGSGGLKKLTLNDSLGVLFTA